MGVLNTRMPTEVIITEGNKRVSYWYIWHTLKFRLSSLPLNILLHKQTNKSVHILKVHLYIKTICLSITLIPLLTLPWFYSPIFN